MKNWDLLLEQADVTLNVILPSRINSKISMYTELNITFGYNITTMAPPGTITLVHNKPHNRGTGVPHRQEG